MTKLKKSLIAVGVLVAIPIGILAKAGADHYMVSYFEGRLVKHQQAKDSYEKMRSYFDEKLKQEEKDERETICTLYQLKTELGYITLPETAELCGSTPKGGL